MVMKTKPKQGFITGRFQVFHNGHLEYALQAKSEVDFLIVGVCNPDAKTTRANPADNFRHQPARNPFTYYERLVMIETALADIGLKSDEFAIVPCPINVPELIASYIPTGTLHLTRVCDDWGYEKIRILEKQGYASKILYENISAGKSRKTRLPIGGIGPERFIMIEGGKSVRDRMMAGDNWRSYVPAGTARAIDELGLIAKLKKAA